MLEIYIPRSWPKDTFRGGGFNLRVQEGLISGEILGNFVNFCVKEEESGLFQIIEEGGDLETL